jgi:hypothetical protein
VADASRKGRLPLKTHCKHGHPLSGDNVLPVNGGTGRRCRACKYLEAMIRKRTIRKAAKDAMS